MCSTQQPTVTILIRTILPDMTTTLDRGPVKILCTHTHSDKSSDMTTTLDRGPVKTLCTHTHSDNLPNPRQRGHHLQMGAQGPVQTEGRGS